MLNCQGLTKSFGALTVVRDVTLDIADGERHAIIGPNGAGKTTLFNLLGGVIPVDSGIISLDGKDVTALAPERRAKLGLCRSFQRNSCFFDMTVGENLAAAVVLAESLEWHGWRSMRRYPSVFDKVKAIAASVGIGELIESPARTLSYGTQRQLEVGLALAGEPRLLLLDEPTAGMSPEETRNIQSLIENLPRSLTLIIIEHDMDVVFSLADRVTVLDAGAILMQGSPSEVRASAAVQTRYLGEAWA